MKTSYFLIPIFLFLESCTYKPFPKEKYQIADSYRDLFTPYTVGDTLIFKSSTNLVDSFIISGIDSSINDRNGYFINARNSKSISATYRQIPIDRWQHRWLEGKGDGKLHEHSEDGTFISIVKFPDTDETEYYFNFKEFRCSKNGLPKLYMDTIRVDNQKFTNYYKIENCAISPDNPNAIKVCFSTVDKGLVAFITYNGISWTRQN